MNQMEQYDEHIARIMDKIEKIKDKTFSITCGKWPPVWKRPFREVEVAVFEKKKGIRLPEDYRRFITTVASAGSQPFYGLLSFQNQEERVEYPFPYTLNNGIYFPCMTEEEMDLFYGDEEDDDKNENSNDTPPFASDCGLLALCTEGCGMDSVLVVNSEDADTYGTVWFYDIANDFGIMPMRDQETGKPFHFLDWLEYWVDRTAGLNSNQYFSFSETVQLPKVPDNPDIMGRKMGWIE